MNSNIDPDINVNIPDNNCNYYDQNEFLDDFITSTDIKLLHFNARSLRKTYQALFSILI